MRKITLLPCASIGDFKLGMHFKQIRNLLGKDFRSFSRRQDLSFLTSQKTIENPNFPSKDQCLSHGVLVYYNKLGYCCAISFTSEFKAFLQDKNVFEELSVAEIREYLSLIDDNFTYTSQCLISEALGIEVYFQAEVEPEDYNLISTLPPNRIVVFSPEYHSDSSSAQ